VELPERAKQRRWTVLLRAILAIPLGVVVLGIAIAAFVCVVIGWFAAVFTGRVPAFTRNLVTILLRTSARLNAYVFLLTDVFPPFSTVDVPEYPARVAVPEATKMNRAAVLFRLVLVIPANVVVSVVEYGLLVFAFFMWIVVLITGWLPQPVHDAYRAFIRYQTRVVGYFYLLVPTYPGGLFGDPAGPIPTPAPAPVPPPASFDAPASPDAPALAPSGQPAVVPGPAPPRQLWSLILGVGAKRVLVLAIVLGIPAFVGTQVLANRSNSGVTHQANKQNLVGVNNALVDDINAFGVTANQCGTVACLEHANLVLSQQLNTFVTAMESSDTSGVRQSSVNQVTAAAQSAEQATAALANGGPTIADYRTVSANVHAVQRLEALITAQKQYVTALNGS
jgi:hypothetical protein